MCKFTTVLYLLSFLQLISTTNVYWHTLSWRDAPLERSLNHSNPVLRKSLYILLTAIKLQLTLLLLQNVKAWHTVFQTHPSLYFTSAKDLPLLIYHPIHLLLFSLVFFCCSSRTSLKASNSTSLVPRLSPRSVYSIDL